jgi:tRNA (cytidine/uridine-2'-O-)-methyltransferase
MQGHIVIDVILFEPEIPPNTGNVIRLCANTGARLHLVEPLGFAWDDTRVKRAGLDYHEFAEVKRHADYAACLDFLNHPRVFAFSSKANTRFDNPEYQSGDALLFGPETRGLPVSILESLPESRRLRLPMRDGQRSLNLSNTVAVAVYEVWRQLEFQGARL